MNEREREVPQQEDLAIRTGIKAGDDNGQLGTGSAVGPHGSGTGGATNGQLGTGN